MLSSSSGCVGLWVCLRRLEWGRAGHRVDGVIMVQVNADHTTVRSTLTTCDFVDSMCENI